MTVDSAITIFKDIESKKYTDIEKAEAILSVLGAQSYIQITGSAALRVVKYLFFQLYDAKLEIKYKEPNFKLEDMIKIK